MRLKANVVCDTQQEPSDHPSDCSIALMGGSVCVLVLVLAVGVEGERFIHLTHYPSQVLKKIEGCDGDFIVGQ